MRIKKENLNWALREGNSIRKWRNWEGRKQIISSPEATGRILAFIVSETGKSFWKFWEEGRQDQSYFYVKMSWYFEICWKWGEMKHEKREVRVTLAFGWWFRAGDWQWAWWAQNSYRIMKGFQENMRKREQSRRRSRFLVWAMRRTHSPLRDQTWEQSPQPVEYMMDRGFCGWVEKVLVEDTNSMLFSLAEVVYQTLRLNEITW